jgi:hypothetical protein
MLRVVYMFLLITSPILFRIYIRCELRERISERNQRKLLVGKEKGVNRRKEQFWCMN